MPASTSSPRAHAIDLARELVATTRYTREAACTAALKAVPACKLSRDQLKAVAFGEVRFHGFGVPSVD